MAEPCPLEELYCIVWMDAIHYKVKEQGKVKSRAVYNILGIDKEGEKDLPGARMFQKVKALISGLVSLQT